MAEVDFSKMLSYSRQDERAGRLQFGGWLIPEIGLSIMHVSVWLSPCSLRGALAHQRRSRKERTLEGDNLFTSAAFSTAFLWILNFTVIGPPEKSKDHSIHSDQYEIIHKIQRINLSEQSESV